MPNEQKQPVESYGTCCVCESKTAVRNIVCLNQKAPVPGKGWGCFQCKLPSDGAVAILCDECIEKNLTGKIKFACALYAANPDRVPISNLTGEHKHDMRFHEGEK